MASFFYKIFVTAITKCLYGEAGTAFETNTLLTQHSL